ncbi:inactive pancreatic lipase-related protein 1 [Lepeophtheirus salmonis]|uniref:inactive pancreatic lipase-related protein 1 n=1 Tax=Lepeophtheirus salmonis TaxID=72036 RepID=UPI001AE4D82A|nr:inactive pancreatic lipase-related protein 1-like [Lepeophtheirus salmonis]
MDIRFLHFSLFMLMSIIRGTNQKNVLLNNGILMDNTRTLRLPNDHIETPKSRFFWPKEKCYPDFGCFKPISLLGFNSFPLDGHSMQVIFELYTRRNPEDPMYLSFNDSSKITSSTFDVKKETKMFTHGFTGRCDKVWCKRLIEELLKKGNFNVICVDWRKDADSSYRSAAANTQMVGTIIAMFFEMVENQFEPIHQRSHLIGHSIGAHAMGYAGFRKSGIKRITGLDPAGLAFDGVSSDLKLDPSDASFVDVIHTNGQSVFQGGFGSLERMGHVDFYPNGGDKQPGCTNAILSLLNIFNLSSEEKRRKFKCNHERSVKIFTESIYSSCQFLGKRCHNWESYLEGNCSDQNAIAFGYNSENISAPDGKYYFATGSHVPLCCKTYNRLYT